MNFLKSFSIPDADQFVPKFLDIMSEALKYFQVYILLVNSSSFFGYKL